MAPRMLRVLTGGSLGGSGALIASELALVAVGLATLRSGLSGEVVSPPLGNWSVAVWLIVPPILVSRWAVDAYGWARAAAVVLALSMPIVAYFSYAMGSYDSRPWWEAISGAIMAAAALCLLVAAGVRGRAQRGSTVNRGVWATTR
jgi:hypothetical protein